MSCSFGLYFGNTNFYLTLFKDGKPTVITNDSGDRQTPAVLAINETEYITGLAAKAVLARTPSAVVTNVKQLLIANDDKIDDMIAKCTCALAKTKKGLQYTLVHTERSMTLAIEQVLTRLFKRMYTMASNAVRNEPSLKLVMAVPRSLNETQLQRVTESAADAGFKVVQVISEPAAALLAHNIGTNRAETCNVLVYRLGGLSCDCSVVSVAAGMYEVLDTIHCSNLGGNFFTKLLADFIASEFMRRWKLDPQESKRSMYKLYQIAENCKHILSTLSESNVFVESLCEGIDWRQNITRPRFENLISSHLPAYIQPINDCLEKLGPITIDKVILCGGSVKIPKLQSTIAALLPDSELIFDRPDEVIAEGCARQASFIDDAWSDSIPESLTSSIPVLANPLIFCDQNDDVKVRVESLTPLPCTVKIKIPDVPQTLKIYESNICEDGLLNSVELTQKIVKHLDVTIVENNEIKLVFV